MACELFNCVPEIKESNESGKFIWKHNCSVKKKKLLDYRTRNI